MGGFYEGDFIMIHNEDSEQFLSLINEWYTAIRQRNLEKSINLKTNIDLSIDKFEQDLNLILHYHLVNFRYDYLIDKFSIKAGRFDIIDRYDIHNVSSVNSPILYYYYFFKALYYNVIGNYKDSMCYYYKAESYLPALSDELEQAEFFYMLGCVKYESFQGTLALKEVENAKQIFSRDSKYITNVAFCENTLGLIYTQIKEFSLAKKHFYKALNIFGSINEEIHILMTKQNLALMYGEQNYSSVAIEYLSNINSTVLNNYKSLFIEARERYKLKEFDIALERIERGICVCQSIQNVEYLHHFYILQALVTNVPAIKLECLIYNALEYFEKEGLMEYKIEYTELLADVFYSEDNLSMACKYFKDANKIKNIVVGKVDIQ